MSLLVAVTIPLMVSGAAPKLELTLNGVRSDVAEWPAEKLEQVAAASLTRTAEKADAVHVLLPSEEGRGDVAVRGRLTRTKDGGVRFTFSLLTQACPVLDDKVAWDFKSARLSPAALDTMSIQLATRASALHGKAKAAHATSCIDAELRAVAPAPPTPAPTPQPQRGTTPWATFGTPTQSSNLGGRVVPGFGWGTAVGSQGQNSPAAPPSNY